MKIVVQKKGQRKWRNYTGIFLFVTLILSILYVIIKIFVSPSAFVNAGNYTIVKSKYILMFLQCILGIFVMTIPLIIEKKKSIDIPDGMVIVYFVFLFFAIYLGEVRNFYHIIPYWDTILHAFSGFMLGALGFTLVSFFNENKCLQFNLSPFFVALFAFCFALAAGAVWEIYEYLADGLFNINMQVYALEDGIQLVGRMALADTMKDLIVHALSAWIISTIGYYSIKRKQKARIEV